MHPNKLRELTLLCDHPVSSRLHYSLFRIAPFRKGHALVFASTVRDLLLREIGSVTFTAASITRPAGMCHEFLPLPGLRETLPEILERVRQVPLRITGAQSKVEGVARLSWRGRGVLTAADISLPEGIALVDPTQELALAVSPHAELDIKLRMAYTKGFSSCVYQGFSTPEITIGPARSQPIPLDSPGNPVQRVNYFIKQTDCYEFLLFEVWTNGSLTPSEAFGHASIAAKQIFQPLV